MGNFESFAHLEKINEFEIERNAILELDTHRHIAMDSSTRVVAFRLQTEPVGEVGVQGCQQIEMITLALEQIKWFQDNSKCPCRENAIAITKLEEALMWLDKRKQNRIARGVEGFDKQ